MRKDRIIRKFLITLTVLGCIFGLFFGAATAKSNTSQALEGEGKTVITASEIAQFIQSKFYP